MASSAKVVTFGGFQCRVALFRMAGVALRACPKPLLFDCDSLVFENDI